MAEGDLQKIVGRNLRNYRTAARLSQEAFAEVLGYHRTYVGGLERGERNLSLRALERIAAQLERSPMDLMMEPGATEPEAHSAHSAHTAGTHG